MARRAFADPAKRSWWQVHIEAWRRSGLTATEYCRRHRLGSDTFRVWRIELTDWEREKCEHAERRRKYYRKVSKDFRQKAVQAFWAMHVEAWIWSGLSLRQYSSTHRLSPHSLKRWRNMIETSEFELDWRTMLHPSALPLVSNKIGTSAKEKVEAERLTKAIEDAAPVREIKRRRRFTTEQKIAILLEVERHGESMSSVSRAYGLSPSLMFRWREKFGLGQEKPAVLVPVRIAEANGGRAGTLIGRLPCPEGMQEVELADGRRVYAPADTDPEDVRRTAAERESAQ